MAAIFYLEDGRVLRGSTLGMAAMLSLIADQMPDTHAQLRRWLEDKSLRGAPFVDFDMRHRSEGERQAFWTAAKQAHASVLERFGHPDTWPDNMYSGYCLLRLNSMRESMDNGDPPLALSDSDKVAPHTKMDESLDEIWFGKDLDDASPAKE